MTIGQVPPEMQSENDVRAFDRTHIELCHLHQDELKIANDWISWPYGYAIFDRFVYMLTLNGYLEP